VSSSRYRGYLDGRMGRKLVDMSELEYSVVPTVVVAAVVHYTRLARVARGRSLSISTMGFCLFHISCTEFYLRHCISILCHVILFNGHYFAVSRTLGENPKSARDLVMFK